MLYRAMMCAVAGVLVTMTQAGAATYTYTGIPSDGHDGNDYFVSATVDLSCAGQCSSGTYSEGSTLTSFTLSIDGPYGPGFSLSNTSPEYRSDGIVNYVTLSNVGGVVTITNWGVFAGINADPKLDYAIATFGNDVTYGNGTWDYFSDRENFDPLYSGTLGANPGLWAGPGIISAAPLPAALPLFAGGLGVMGLLARRRKRKASAIAA